jgi:hypothetical protein
MEPEEGSDPLDFTAIGDQVYFTIRGPGGERIGYRTDAQAEGVEPMLLAADSSPIEEPKPLGALAGTHYIRDNTSVYRDTSQGFEPITIPGLLVFSTSNAVELGAHLFFLAQATNGDVNIYQLDSENNVTMTLVPPAAAISPGTTQVFSFVDRLIFLESGPTADSGVYEFIPVTSAPTLIDIPPGRSQSSDPRLTGFPNVFLDEGQMVLFHENDSGTVDILLNENGGTTLVENFDINPSDYESVKSLGIDNSVASQAVFILISKTPGAPAKFLISDETSQGTYIWNDRFPSLDDLDLSELREAVGSGSSDAVITLVFAAAIQGEKALQSSGIEPFVVTTQSGPTRIVDLNPGPASSNPSEFFTLGSDIYFAANDGIHGHELWRLTLIRPDSFIVK